MTTTNQNIEVYRGNSKTVFVALTAADGSPYNPSTASSIRWRVANSAMAADAESLIEKDDTNGIVAVDGGINIVLSDADTDMLAGLYYHELKVYDVSLDDISTAMTGTFIVKRSLPMQPPAD